MAKRVGANRQRRLAEKRGRANTRRSAPAWRHAALKVMGVAVVLGAAAFAGDRVRAHGVAFLERFTLKNITVRGIQALDTATVVAAAGIARDAPLHSLDVGAARRRIAGLPWVKKVRAHRRLPDGLAIMITERRPIALVNLDSVRVIDAEGVLLPLKPGAVCDLPLLGGLEDSAADDGTRRLTARSMAAVRGFFDAVRRSRQDLGARIAQVDFADGAAVCVKLEALPARIELGSDRLVDGMRDLGKLLRYFRREGSPNPRRIDLRCAHCAFVR